MEKIGKKLVFHFYLGKDGIDTECNNLHFKCLEHYATNVFNKVVFVIVVDDAEAQKEEILRLEKKVTELFNSQELQIKVTGNTYLRDSRTFYDEIATKLEETNELVLFAHNKGTTNLKKFEREKILKWISAMYFSCLNDVNYVEDSITELRAIAFGGLLNIVTEDVRDKHQAIAGELGKYGYLYTGTFFWINARTLFQYMTNNGIELPEIKDRWYAENFLANIIPSDLCTSPSDWRVMNYLDAHDNILSLINMSFPNDLLLELNEFYSLMGVDDMTNAPVIEIVYIATNNYINYIGPFLETLKYFYPGAKKILKILTNQPWGETFDIPCKEIIKVEIIKIFDLFYPCINLHKAMFIEQMEHDENAEYIFYFDADTKFINKPDYDWDGLRASMDKGYFIMSLHPIYVMADQEWKTAFLNNLFFNGITDKADNFAASIPSDTYSYVISSFFCGKKDTMLHVCRGINDMIREDMRWQKGYHIPRFSDEAYFNKLVYNRENNLDTTYCIRIDYFICIEEHEHEDIPTLFLYQKGFDEKFKSVKR